MWNEIIVSGTIKEKQKWNTAVEYQLATQCLGNPLTVRCISDEINYECGDEVLIKGELVYLYGSYLIFVNGINKMKDVPKNHITLIGDVKGLRDNNIMEINVHPQGRINDTKGHCFSVWLWDSVFKIAKEKHPDAQFVGIWGSFDGEKVIAQRISFVTREEIH